MLLRFGVQNHLSIKEYQEISCIASRPDNLDHARPLENKLLKGISVLPAAALYGANASGKSNFLDAMYFFRRAVRRSYSEWPDTKKLPHSHFSLDTDSTAKESLYDCDLVIDGIRYSYGFSLTGETIHKEWLYAYPKGVRNVIFHREKKQDKVNAYFGPSARSIGKSLRTIAQDNKVLLLSSSGRKENHHHLLTPVYEFIDQKMRFLQLGDLRTRFYEESLGEALYDDQETISKITKILKIADLGITRLNIKKKARETKDIDREMEFLKAVSNLLPPELNSSTEGRFENAISKERYEIKFDHLGEDQKKYAISFQKESMGTKYLLPLLYDVFHILKSSGVLVVDEITTNLHTKLSEVIIKLFTSKETNPNNAQFLFSTHDTNLLSRETLRRDEIWFAEKDRDGKTSIYPLSDFSTRHTDNIEKGYLQGRFGAIPFMGNIDALLG